MTHWLATLVAILFVGLGIGVAAQAISYPEDALYWFGSLAAAVYVFGRAIRYILAGE